MMDKVRYIKRRAQLRKIIHDALAVEVTTYMANSRICPTYIVENGWAVIFSYDEFSRPYFLIYNGRTNNIIAYMRNDKKVVVHYRERSFYAGIFKRDAWLYIPSNDLRRYNDNIENEVRMRCIDTLEKRVAKKVKKKY